MCRAWWAGGAGVALMAGTVAGQANDGEAFKARLVAALASGNPRQIAALVRYPIRVRHGMLAYPIPVNNAGQMAEMHGLFFTPEMRCAIEESRIPRPGEPKPRNAMLVADGVISLANGKVVALRTPQGYRITALDVVGHPSGGKPKPKDAAFRYGEGELIYTGRIGGSDADGYVVRARKGALLQVKLERFPGRSLQIRVTDQQTGMVVTGAPTEFSRLWAARTPSDGTYLVEIVRRAAYCDPSVTYLLTIGLRG